MALFHTIFDIESSAALLRRRRWGMIEVADGQLVRIVLRPWPKFPTWAEARLLGDWRHRWRAGKVCRLYYNQPIGKVNFLTLAYVQSDRDASFQSFRSALAILDEIARIKRA